MLYIKENVVNHIKECISALKIKETDSLEKVKSIIVECFDFTCGEKREEQLYLALNETELFIMVDEIKICSIIGGGVPTKIGRASCRERVS